MCLLPTLAQLVSHGSFLGGLGKRSFRHCCWVFASRLKEDKEGKNKLLAVGTEEIQQPALFRVEVRAVQCRS